MLRTSPCAVALLGICNGFLFMTIWILQVVITKRTVGWRGYMCASGACGFLYKLACPFFLVLFPPDLIATVSGYSWDLKTARFICFNLSLFKMSMYWKPRIGLTYSWGFCGWFLIIAVFPHAELVVLHQFGQHRKLKSHQLCHKGWSSACATVAQRLQCLGLTNVVYFRLEISCMCVPILSIYLCRLDVYGTSQCFIYVLLAKQIIILCVRVKVRVMQKAAHSSTLLKCGQSVHLSWKGGQG